MRKIAIVGGGISGLISIKCCLDGGLLPTCYEMTNDIGGLWNYDTNAIEGKASVMKSTVINTSKEFMALSDFPPPNEFPNFMHNSKLLEYFRKYADNFNLTKYVRFRKRIVRIEPTDDYEQTGCWIVYSVDSNQNNQEASTDETAERYDAVMLATGHHAHPRWATFPGLDNFKGRKLHSWQYKTPHGFEDKTVLVIGLGNSGGDLAVELGRAAKQVYLSTRRGTWVINRLGPNGWPTDMVYSSELIAKIQNYFPSLMDWFLERDMNQKFDHEMYGLKPSHRATAQHPFVNDEFANRVLCGSVIVKPNVKQFTDDGHGVVFEDGSKVDHIDCVILATGFNITFPYLDKKILPVNENAVRLYKYVWPPHLSHPTLAVIALVQPFGAINPIAELQARWAVQVFKGEFKLPSAEIMNEDIDEKMAQMSKRFISSPRHTVEVDHLAFCNEIADQVGCRPDIFYYLKHDFKLGWILLTGSATPYRYRLQGPNKWEGARQAILTQYERVKCPLAVNRGKNQSQQAKFMLHWTPMFSFVFFLILAVIIFQTFL